MNKAQNAAARQAIFFGGKLKSRMKKHTDDIGITVSEWVRGLVVKALEEADKEKRRGGL